MRYVCTTICCAVHMYNMMHCMYRIAGNFGKVFNLANWRFYRKSQNLKSAIFYSDVI